MSRGFPDRAAVIRLVGAVLAEQTDEWAEQRRYLGSEILAKARATTTPRPTTEVMTSGAISAEIQSTKGTRPTTSSTTSLEATLDDVRPRSRGFPKTACRRAGLVRLCSSTRSGEWLDGARDGC